MFTNSTLASLTRLNVISSPNRLACLPPQKRSFATRRAPPAPKPRPGPSRAEFFDPAEISYKTFEQVIQAEKSYFSKLTEAQYYEALVKFHEAIKNGSDPYAVKFAGGTMIQDKCIKIAANEKSSDNGVPATILYDLGGILSNIGGRASAALKLALWASASELGHVASTLSASRVLIESGNWGKSSNLKKVETRFKQIVSEGKDPNALVLQGELYYQEGKFEAASRIIQIALRLGSPTFEWKALGQRCLGNALTKLQRRPEAIKALEEAVVESGFVPAMGDLGQLLRESDPERAEQLLYTATGHGDVKWFSHLSEMAIEKQLASSDDKASKEHQRWAMEWARLADPKASY